MSESSAKEAKKKEGVLQVLIRRDFCKGCGICVAFCPKGVLAMRGAYAEVVALENCSECLQCEMRCPDFAVSVNRVTEGQGE